MNIYLQKKPNVAKIIFSIYIIGQCIVTGYTARVTSTPGFPITNLVNSNNKIIYPVKIQNSDNAFFESLSKIKKQVKNKQLLYIGSNSLAYILTESNVCAPLTISTPIYDEQWVIYYNKISTIPDKIIIDKSFYENIEMFQNTILGKYLLENNDYNLTVNNDYLILLEFNN